MHRATRQTLVLLLLSVAVAIVLVQAAGRPGSSTAPARPLLAIDPASIRAVERHCAGCAPLRIERQAGRWRLIAPWQLPADPVAVARLTEIAGLPVQRELAAQALDPAALGLAPPLATLRLDEHRLAFGTTDAIDNRRYVHHGGGIALVADRFSSWLLAGPERYVSPRPLAGVRRPAPRAGGWNAEQIAILRGARALAVHTHASRPPPDAPRLADASGALHAYWWAREQPDTVLRAQPPLAYTLPADVAQALRAARTR